MPETDAELLRRFIRYRDEDAFRILADRYLGLIYNAAFRRSGHRQIAEEAAQNVLSLLVRKAPDLVHETATLPGWLHRAATLEAANLLRIERRHLKGKEALMREITNPLTCPEPTWKQVVPHLDAALARLPEIDRSIVLMHYLQGKTHNEIAPTIGKTASAVQRRCHRSIGKLARMLRARGITISVTTLASSLSTESRAAPLGLLTKAVTGALCNPGTLTLPFISKLFLLMTTTQKVILTGASVALLASVPILIQHRYLTALRSTPSTEPQPTNSQQEAPLTAAVPSQPISQTDKSSDRRTINTSEAELAAIKEELEATQNKIDQLLRPLNKPMLSAMVKTEIGPDEVLVTGGYQLPNGKYQFTFVSPESAIAENRKDIIKVTTTTVNLDDEMVASAGLQQLATNAGNTLQHAEAWTKDEFQTTAKLLEATANIDFSSSESEVAAGQSYLNIYADSKPHDEEDIGFHLNGQDQGVIFMGGLFDFRDGEAGFEVSMRIENTDVLSLDFTEMSEVGAAFGVNGFNIIRRGQ